MVLRQLLRRKDGGGNQDDALRNELLALVLGISVATDVAVELRPHLLNSWLAGFSVENRHRPGARSAVPVRDAFGCP
jgi:hypothetical protein